MTAPLENPQWRLWVDIIDQECRRQFNTRRPERHHPDAELAARNQIFPFQTYYGGAGHIWTWEEVEAETRHLADQAKDANHA